MEASNIAQLQKEKKILDVKLRKISDKMDDIRKTKESQLTEVDEYTTMIIQDIIKNSNDLKDTIRASNSTLLDEFDKILQDIKLFSRNDLQSRIISGLLLQINSSPNNAGVSQNNNRKMDEILKEISSMLDNLSEIDNTMASLSGLWLMKCETFDPKTVISIVTEDQQSPFSATNGNAKNTNTSGNGKIVDNPLGNSLGDACVTECGDGNSDNLGAVGSELSNTVNSNARESDVSVENFIGIFASDLESNPTMGDPDSLDRSAKLLSVKSEEIEIQIADVVSLANSDAEKAENENNNSISYTLKGEGEQPSIQDDVTDMISSPSCEDLRVNNQRTSTPAPQNFNLTNCNSKIDKKNMEQSQPELYTEANIASVRRISTSEPGSSTVKCRCQEIHRHCINSKKRIKRTDSGNFINQDGIKDSNPFVLYDAESESESDELTLNHKQITTYYLSDPELKDAATRSGNLNKKSAAEISNPIDSDTPATISDNLSQRQNKNYEETSDDSDFEVKRPRFTYSDASRPPPPLKIKKGINTGNIINTKRQTFRNQQKVIKESPQEYSSGASADLEYFPWRICLIHNYLWCAGWQNIYKYDLNCQLVDVIRNDKVTCVSSVSGCFTGNIIAACCHRKGLHELDSTGSYMSKITTGSFTDVCQHEHDLIALEHGLLMFRIIRYNQQRSKWIPFKTVDVSHKSQFYWDRLSTHDGKIYISSYSNHCFYIYDFNGKLLHKYGSPGKVIGQSGGKLKYPRLAQVTESGEVVLADTNNDRIQHCSKDGKWSGIRLPGGLGRPVDATYDAKTNNIWVVQHKPLKLLKYTRIWQF